MDELRRISSSTMKKWQQAVDILAKVVNVPAALIMQFKDPYLEVFITSATDSENPYRVGDKEKKHGLYCETVIEKQAILNIPNALEDEDWKNNPDIKLGMINYLGAPVNWPDGIEFGTICILDRKTREYDQNILQLVKTFADLVEIYLQVEYDKSVIQSQNEIISTFSKLLPICSYCQKIRNDENSDEWIPIQKYLESQTKRNLSHGICPSCYETETEGM